MPAIATTRTPDRAASASQARSAEMYHLHTAAGYEAGVREPGCWDHIGRHMRHDAEPVRLTPRRVHRSHAPRRYALSDLCIAFLLVGVIAGIVFGVL